MVPGRNLPYSRQWGLSAMDFVPPVPITSIPSFSKHPMPPSILIVDDDSKMRELLRALLEEQGFHVHDAEDGEAALRQLHKQPSDLLITDIVMPNKEGLETIREVQQHFPHIKIIAMSGDHNATKANGYLAVASALGAHRTIGKPFLTKELLNHINELLPEQ